MVQTSAFLADMPIEPTIAVDSLFANDNFLYHLLSGLAVGESFWSHLSENDDYTTKWIRAGSPTRTKPLASVTPKEWPHGVYAPRGYPRALVFENLGIRGEYTRDNLTETGVGTDRLS